MIILMPRVKNMEYEDMIVISHPIQLSASGEYIQSYDAFILYIKIFNKIINIKSSIKEIISKIFSLKIYS